MEMADCSSIELSSIEDVRQINVNMFPRHNSQLTI
jgi:hypothetical protein